MAISSTDSIRGDTIVLMNFLAFQAEISRHVVGDREWEVYRVHLGDDHELCSSRDKIVKGVTKMLMGWH